MQISLVPFKLQFITQLLKRFSFSEIRFPDRVMYTKLVWTQPNSLVVILPHETLSSLSSQNKSPHI